MIKNIVFDMGNVLISYDPFKYTSLFADNEEDGELLYREIFKSVEWIKLDRGIITIEEAISSINTRLPERLHDKVKELFDNWHRELPSHDEIEDLVIRLKNNGYKIYLLSNTSIAYHQFKANISAIQHFDGEFISAEYNMLKPELRIYETFYDTFSLKPEECLFIDDNSANIEAAELTGMKGIVYHGDVVALENTMSNYGIRL
ncbi:HAD family hydrolase [Alloiococcus sp. CFN-8]|uniref:HAD family hydrolase n=1 Tax=Alloiococcus sp. CFN-8 TaxID=3416081 RepID=UPI003CE6BE91